MDAQTFRTDFPAFVDETIYPDAQVNFYLGLGTKLLSSPRWSDLRDYGLELFVAHNLVLSAMDAEASSAGDQPGTNTGAVASMAVDKVNISFDNTASLDEKAGHWNLTTYGKQFIRLARMVGTGGVQL